MDTDLPPDEPVPPRRRITLPPETPPISHNSSQWTSKDFAQALCGGLQRTPLTTPNDIHCAYMDMLQLLPTHTLAGLYNAYFAGEQDGFEESLVEQLLDRP